MTSNLGLMRVATLIVATLALIVGAGDAALIIKHNDDQKKASARIERAIKNVGDDLASCVMTRTPDDPDVPKGGC